MIRSIRATVVAVLCLGNIACQPTSAAAQEVEGFSAADRAKVEARIDQLDRSMSAGDLAAALDVVPPRVFQTVALRAGATEEQLRAAVRQIVATQMQGVTFISYDMDLVGASPIRTPDGSRTYLLIPTASVIEISGIRVRTTTTTLALEEGGEWYLIRIDDQNQVAVVKELWPEFAPIQFPAGTSERLQ